MRKLLNRTAAAAAVLALAACTHPAPKEGGVESAAHDGQKVEITGRAPLHGKTIGEADPSVADTVYFDYDKSSLRQEALPVLGRVAEWIRRYPEVQIMIAGHADERGTREYNLALGNLRATAVKNYLVSLGIPAQRLDTVSYGKERPAVVGSSEEAWSKNRRAVAEIE